MHLGIAPELFMRAEQQAEDGLEHELNLSHVGVLLKKVRAIFHNDGDRDDRRFHYRKGVKIQLRELASLEQLSDEET